MKNFIRKAYISAVISSCILFGFFACCCAYENMRQTGFGDYRKAIEIEDGKLKFFDFEMKF